VFTYIFPANGILAHGAEYVRDHMHSCDERAVLSLSKCDVHSAQQEQSGFNVEQDRQGARERMAVSSGEQMARSGEATEENKKDTPLMESSKGRGIRDLARRAQ
jgi:hypothetical protein